MRPVPRNRVLGSPALSNKKRWPKFPSTTSSFYSDQIRFPCGKVSYLGLVASASSVSSRTRVATGFAAVATAGVAAAATEAAAETTAAGEQAANSRQQAANATSNSLSDARTATAAVAASARVAVAAARSAADGYRNLLFDAARNANGAGVRNLRANSLAALNGPHFRHLTADAVRNLASPSFAFPTDGAARNLLGAGFANPAGNAAVNLLGASFANPTSHAVVDRLRFANPLGHAVVDSLGARLANPASHANRNLLANRFATVLGAGNLSFFAGGDPYFAADGPVRSLAANAIEVTAAMSPAAGARIEVEAATVPNQLAVAAARDNFLSGFPMTAADHHRLGFGVRNANGLGNVAHLSLSDSAANVVRHFPALHFANRTTDVDRLGQLFLDRNANRVVDGVGNRLANRTTNRVVHGLVGRLANWPTNSVLLSPVSGLTNRAGHRNLLLFDNSRPDVSRPGDFLLFPNDPALSPHHGVTAIGITGGSSPSGTNSTVAGATTTLGPAEAGRHRCNHSCSSQQTSYDLHFSSPKKYLTFQP